MKIYVVTSGAYSDYSIEAVFLDKKKAGFYSKYHTFFGDGRVEEYETMDDSYEVNVLSTEYFNVVLHNNGDLAYITEKVYERLPEDRQFEESFKHEGDEFVGNIVADTKEQAIKIMRDKRAEWLAKTYGV